MIVARSFAEHTLWPRPWRVARRVAFIALLLPGPVLGLVAVDAWLRGGRPEHAAAEWIGRLGVSTPSLWPAGDPLHYPPEAAP